MTDDHYVNDVCSNDDGTVWILCACEWVTGDCMTYATAADCYAGHVSAALRSQVATLSAERDALRRLVNTLQGPSMTLAEFDAEFIARLDTDTPDQPTEPVNDCAYDGGLCDHRCIDACFREFSRIPARPTPDQGTEGEG